MARIAGVDLPRQKHINIALTYIYGIGQPRAGRILDEAKVDPMKKVQDLSEEEVNRIRTVIESEGMVEGDLRKEVSMNIKRLIEIGSYRGFRHRPNLPVRGQRTDPHARTRKGTPFAAQQAASNAANMARDHGVRSVDVRVSGPGSGRESAVRALAASGIEVRSIRDVTPIPHNGCRPPKRRRV